MQLVKEGFAEGLLALPYTIADNCGFESAKLISELLYIHKSAEITCSHRYGICLNEKKLCNTFANGIWDSVSVKKRQWNWRAWYWQLNMSFDEKGTCTH